MKKRSGKHIGVKRAQGKRNGKDARRRGGGADAARIGAMLLTGSFAIAQVPVYAAGAGALPVPCPGSGAACIGGTGKSLGWDQLRTGSSITTGNAGMVISQVGNAGIFNWASFNISPGYTVQFIQPSTSSVALNRIFDPNVTTIAGNLIANGQIYLVNPNGILFGSGANVNVAGLIASTSNITDARITSGLLAANTNILNPDYADPVFTNNASVLGNSVADSPVASANANPAIVVQSGASLYAAGRNTHGTVVSAGRIFLFAPTVENGGTIKVDGGGQVILAAGTDVYLGSSSEPSLRGLLVEVDGSTASGVTVDASGSISVAHGNITLMGLAVNQAGTLSATSALDANGSISLIARQANPTSTANVTDPSVLMPIAETGTVTVASGSKTTVTLDPTDTATAPLDDPTAAALVSTINIQGLNVNIGGNGSPGSTLIQAHGGDVTVTARQATSSFEGNQTYAIGDKSVLGTENTASTINVGSDAVIDVSGLQDVPVNGANEFVYISRLTSLNLADAPLQRNGFLLGQGVYINLADAPSWINVTNLQEAISSTQAQRNTVGGTVALNAEGSVSLAKGSVINVSGGSTYLTAASGRTSELVTANGTDVNISNASANTEYIGFADQGSYTDTDSREGINTTVSWQTPVFTTVGGYTQGANAGTVQIYAPMATLSGTLLGKTISSPQQRSSLPEGGTLLIGSLNGGDLDSQAAIQRGNILLASSASLLQQGLNADLAAATSASGPSPVIALNTTALSQEGFTRLNLTSDGAIELAPGSALNLGPGGSFTAAANAIAIDSSISAPGGSVSLSERPVTTLPDGTSGLLQRDALSFIPESSSLRGSVVFAPGTSVNVAGLWTNDFLGADSVTTPSAPVVLNGGSIAISARTVDVSGASFDVSSGAWLTDTATFSGGSGGSLTLTAKYSSETVINPITTEPADTGVLDLGTDFASRISGFGVVTGGTLSLAAPALQLGSSGSAPATMASGDSPVVIPVGVAQDGFQTFKFTGDDSFVVPAGVNFTPRVLHPTFSSALELAPSSANLLAVAPPIAPLPGTTEPVTVDLAASNTNDGTLLLDEGAVISAGITGSIALQAGNQNLVDGTLLAPAGTVALSLTSSVNLPSAPALEGRSVQLGPNALVDVSGVSLAIVGANGLKTGSVLDAGTVSIDAPLGNVAVDPGAQIQAHGAVDTVDVLQQGVRYQPTVVASAGGTVEISATIGTYLEGTVDARGGSATANGGSLSVALQAANQAFVTNQSDPLLLALLQAPTNLTIGAVLPSLSFGQASFAPVLPTGVAGPSSATIGAQGALPASLINNSGFANVWLQSADQISFSQSLALATRNSLVLSAQTLVAAPGATVQVSSPYVALGPAAQLSQLTDGVTYNAPAAATNGSGNLEVDAGQIDLIGAFSLYGIGLASLDASGAVRGVGVSSFQTPSARVAGGLQFGGNLNITAAQIYPATQTDFAFTTTAAAGDPNNGNLQVSAHAPATSSAAPLSAGGTLTFAVNDFTSSGTVLAPQGSIEVDAGSVTLKAGSVLSVAGSGLVPYGTVLNGDTWTYDAPTTETNAPVTPYVIASTAGTSLAAKAITLNTPSLDAQKGSTIDLAGGGNVYGIGFVTGPGGSYDLSQNFPYTTATERNPYFALVPSIGAGAAPFDPQTYASLVLDPALPSASYAAFHIGQTITIGAGSGLPAGTYTVLPPAYALLPGAYAVESVGGYSNISPSTSVSMPDGSVIVAGKLGYNAAGTASSLWSGFRVYTDAQFQSFSEWTYYYGSQFFPAADGAAGVVAQRVGPDAGSLSIDAGQILLASTVEAVPTAAGRGADIAIDVPTILVTDSPSGSASSAAIVLAGTQPAQPQPELVLDATALSALGAQTLVLGATEERTGTALNLASATPAQTALALTPLAQSVTLNAHAPLLAGEIVLAGSAVSLGAGSSVVTSKQQTPTTTAVVVNGDGALVYVGNDSVSSYARDGASAAGTATTGSLAVGAGATVIGQSAVFDATDTQTYDPSFVPQATNLLLSAALVNFGTAPSGASGLDLNQALLSKFSGATNLTIVSQGGFNAYGNAAIGQLGTSGAPLLASLTLDGPGISGFGAGGSTVTIDAGHVVLETPTGSTVAAAGTGSGALIVNTVAAPASTTSAALADGNVQIDGDIAVSGFQSVTLNANGRALSATQTVANTGDIVFAGAPGQGVGLAISGTGSTLALNATSVTAQSGVNASLTVPGALTIASLAPDSAPQTQQLGASLAIQAQNVDISGRIDLPAGVLQITTTGAAATDGITLDSGAVLRVAGATQTFVPASSTNGAVTADVSAGSLSLTTANGSIVENTGAMLDISGAGKQGDAGTLVLSAANGTVQLSTASVSQGGVAGIAAQAGSAARGADISIDAASLGNFSALATTIGQGTVTSGANSQIAAAPVADAISLRARTGNIVVASTDTLRASSIVLEADGGAGATDGSIQVGGTLDASGASGGQVGIYANNQVVLQAGSLVDAHATAAGGIGGGVTISARVTANPAAPTTLDAIVLDPGSQINTSGGANAAGGIITLRAGANSALTDVMIAPIPAGTLVGARQDVVEGVVVDAVSGSLTVDSGVLATEAAVLANYLNATNIAAITQRLGEGSDPAFSLRPGLEFQAAGDITVTSPIDFATGLSADGSDGSFTWRYGGTTLASSTPGDLTLRASGNVNISASISDGFAPTAPATTTPNGTVWTSGESWSYTFTAGADLSAANPNQVIAQAGDLTIGTGVATNPVTVRTGTGSIALNAGGSVILDNAQGQQGNDVYTAGVASLAGLPAFPALITVVQTTTGFKRLTIDPVLTQYGGSLSITADVNVVGTDAPQGDYNAGTNQDGSAQAVNQWLLRGGLGTAAVPTVWWTYFTDFQQGFGALGGGNLSIHAGGDVVRVGAVVPSNGYNAGTGEVQGNTGALTVSAAGVIEQGLFYDEAGLFNLRANAFFSNPAAQNSGDAQPILAQGSNSLVLQTRSASTVATSFNPLSSAPSPTLVNSKTNADYQTAFFTYGTGSALNVRIASGDLTLLGNPNGSVLPPTVQFEAFGGQIVGPGVAQPVTLFPLATGQLQVLAQGDVTQLNVAMSQSDPTLLAQVAAPLPNSTNELIALAVPSASSAPLHASDPTIAAVVSSAGSLSYDVFDIPKTTQIVAAGNIGPSMSIDIQNSNAASVSVVSAGGQINLSNPTFATDYIFIGGPGAAQVLAGGAINLGTDGAGIVSRGNLDNPALPAVGATLIVAAGVGQSASGYANNPDYVGVIDNFIRYDAFASEGSNSAALNAQVVTALSGDPLLAPLVSALKEGLADRASVSDPNSAFNQAIAALSPAVLAKGGVKLASSVQVVNNLLFVDSENSDTFAPAYAAFGDLFPALNNNAAAIAQFVQNNPFASAPDAASLRSASLQGLPASLAAVIQLGLNDPAAAAQPGSAFAQALAALDPTVLASGARQLLANVLQVAGTSLDALKAANELTGTGTPYAKTLSALAAAFAPTTAVGLNDLQMDYNEVKTEDTGTVAVFAPQGSIIVGSSNPPVLDEIAGAKTADQLGIFSIGGGDIIGMVRDDFNVFGSRVFTVAGGDIDIWSSLGNIDAGRGPRDVAVAAPPQLVTDPSTGVTSLALGASVSGSGIGALETSPDQPPSNINLMAPAGYVDAGEAGIRAETGTVVLGTNLVLNAGNIQAASGVSGGAVVATPPPPLPPSTGSSAGDRVEQEAQREAMAQQQAAAFAASQRPMRIVGEFIGFDDCSDPRRKDCDDDSDDAKGRKDKSKK